MWYTVEGEIVGWLYAGDEDGDWDIAVVKIEYFNGMGVVGETKFALRWLGNDYEVTSRADAEILALGDTIKFSTCKEEQDQYAERGTTA